MNLSITINVTVTTGPQDSSPTVTTSTCVTNPPQTYTTSSSSQHPAPTLTTDRDSVQEQRSSQVKGVQCSNSIQEIQDELQEIQDELQVGLSQNEIVIVQQDSDFESMASFHTVAEEPETELRLSHAKSSSDDMLEGAVASEESAVSPTPLLATNSVPLGGNDTDSDVFVSPSVGQTCTMPNKSRKQYPVGQNHSGCEPYTTSVGTKDLPDTTPPSPCRSLALASPVRRMRRPRRHSAPEHGVPVQYQYEDVFSQEDLASSPQDVVVSSSGSARASKSSTSTSSSAAGRHLSEDEFNSVELGLAPDQANNTPSEPLGPPPASPSASSEALSSPSSVEFQTSLSHPATRTTAFHASYQRSPEESQAMVQPAFLPPRVPQAPQARYSNSEFERLDTAQNYYQPSAQGHYNPSRYGPSPGLAQALPFEPLQVEDHDVPYINARTSGTRDPAPNSPPFRVIRFPSVLDETSSSNSSLAPILTGPRTGVLIPMTKIPIQIEDTFEDPSIDSEQQRQNAFLTMPSTSSLLDMSYEQKASPIRAPQPVSSQTEIEKQSKLHVLADKAREAREARARAVAEERLEEQRKVREEQERNQRLEYEKQRKEREAETERIRKWQRQETKRLRNWELHLQKEEVRLWKEGVRLQGEEQRLVKQAEDRLSKEAEEQRLFDIDALETEHRQKERLKIEEERLQKEEERLRAVADEWYRIKAEEREAQNLQKDRLRAEEERLRKEDERLAKEKERLDFEEDRLRYEEERLKAEKENVRKEAEHMQKLIADRAQKEEEEEARREVEKQETQRLHEEEERKRKDAEAHADEAKRTAEKIREEADHLEKGFKEKTQRLEEEHKEETERLQRDLERLAKEVEQLDKDRKRREATGKFDETLVLKPWQSCLRPTCVACKKMDGLETELKKLTTEYKELLVQVDASHKPPVLRIPTEVLASIFVLSVSELWNSPEKIASSAVRVAPLRLAAVCREWRRVAFASPRLWNSLFLDLRRSPVKHLDAIRNWILRSDKISLYVIYEVGQSQLSKEDAKKLYPIIDALNETSSHWMALTLRLPPLLLSRIQGNPASTPTLDVLAVQTQPGYEFKSQLDFKAARPSPTVVVIMNMRFAAVGIKWDRLTRTQLGGLSIDECLQLFRQAPDLQQCTLTKVTGAGGHFSLPGKPISHGNIAELTFNERSKEALRLFLDNVTFSTLKALSVSTDVQQILPNEALASFFGRSQCSLTKMSISQYSITDDKLLPVLRAAASLTSLYLKPSKSSDYNPQDFFTLLGQTAVPGKADSFLPNLASLTFLPCSDKFDWHYVPVIFGSPSDVSKPGWRPLKSLNIEFRLGVPYSPEIKTKDVIRILGLSNLGIIFKLRDESSGTDILDKYQEEAQVVARLFNTAEQGGGLSVDFLIKNLDSLETILPAARSIREVVAQGTTLRLNLPGSLFPGLKLN